MRKWSWILGAMLSLSACEETMPPPKAAPIVIKMETPKVETPKIETPKIETPKVETPTAKVEEVDQTGDEEMKPMEAVDAARDALSSGELDRALKMAKVGVLKAPKRSAAWNTLGRVQLARGERKSAR
jgi:hypothetical protein